MPVRKHTAAPECQQYSTEHVIAESVNGRFSARDRNALSKHSDQRVLAIERLRAKNLDFLAEWHDLHKLTIRGGRIEDCTALIRLKKLKHLLYIADRSKTPDLSFLSSLAALENLTISYVTHLTALPDLSRSKRLKRLDVTMCRSLEDISTVTKIPKIESFGICGTPQQPEDLEPIMAMKSLKKMSGAFGTAAKDRKFHELLNKHGVQYG
jgi:hypothetical protein